MNRPILTCFLLVMLLMGACRKKLVQVAPYPIPDDTTVVQSDRSTLYGYTVAAADMYDSIATCTFGEINVAKGSISSLANFTNTVIENKAAFNSADKCYYTFFSTTHWAGTSAGASPLYKISREGKVSAFFNANNKGRYSWLTYNKASGKLYCLQRTTLNNDIMEVSLTADSFSMTSVAKPLYPFASSFTCDDATGYIYYVTIDTPASIFHIERYRPGMATPESVVSGAGHFSDYIPDNLCFNSNDKKLYGTRRTWNAGQLGFDFLQIDPNEGVTKLLAHYDIALSTFFFSACIDPVSDRYIFSTVLTGWSVQPPICILGQINMRGEFVKQDTTATLFNGLTLQ